ncbi:MAG TPA: protease inhibitor I42 family protein, partial [Myxococcaceae bacterium]|nr:protease inhibitor I42 family protein [Myxococcaceae bacterium]
VEGLGSEPVPVDAVMNHGLSVRLTERAGYIWAIEPTTAKRVGLREANFEPATNGPATREFFFTPRNPGTFDVDFFLAKAFSPSQVAKTCRLTVNVKTHA